MKKLMSVIFFAVVSHMISFSQGNSKSVIELVYTGVSGTSTIHIYHRLNDVAPFQVRAFTGSEIEPRQFYVLKYSSDVFSYLLVEKVPDQLLYYPLVWSDLQAITLKEVKERSEQVLKGLVKPVPKTSL